jgi:hypothetical protein
MPDVAYPLTENGGATYQGKEELLAVQTLGSAMLMRPFTVVEREVALEARFERRYSIIVFQVDVFILTVLHNRSTKILSSARPRLSMLIAVPACAKRLVTARLVNWTPWSMLKISGHPCTSATSRASRRKAGASELDSCQANTYRLNQSIRATRYRHPLAIRT